MNMVIENSRGQKIYAMNFPYRKKQGIGIYDRHRNAILKVATFNDDESAEIFMRYLAEFVGAREVEE